MLETLCNWRHKRMITMGDQRRNNNDIRPLLHETMDSCLLPSYPCLPWAHLNACLQWHHGLPIHGLFSFPKIYPTKGVRDECYLAQRGVKPCVGTLCTHACLPPMTSPCNISLATTFMAPYVLPLLIVACTIQHIFHLDAHQLLRLHVPSL
jgi:hypothetical protein